MQYFYLIRHIPSQKFYAGCQHGRNANPENFWVTYFTSSKTVHYLINQDGLDSFEILEILERPMNDALLFEHNFLNSVNAAASQKWLNRSNGNNKFYAMIPFSEEHRKNMSLAARNKTLSDTAKFNIKQASLLMWKDPDYIAAQSEGMRKYRNSEKFVENNKKISEKTKGIPKSADHNFKNSESKKKFYCSPAGEQNKKFLSELYKGKSYHTEESKKKAKATRSNKPDVVCPNCLKTGRSAGMTRYHFDNCKSKEEIIK